MHYWKYPPINTFLFALDKCLLLQDNGSCNNVSSKFFYDSQDGVCKTFMYGGCGGNENRFDTKQQCEQHCSDSQGNCW